LLGFLDADLPDSESSAEELDEKQELKSDIEAAKSCMSDNKFFCLSLVSQVRKSSAHRDLGGGVRLCNERLCLRTRSDTSIVGQLGDIIGLTSVRISRFLPWTPPHSVLLGGVLAPA